MTTAERVLTRRELNRALLERQLLLERSALSPVKVVERLGGLQAQSTASPYLSLWTRLERFERDQLTRALTSRRLVKALVQRGTLHIVTPQDYWAFTTARRELGGLLWPPSYEARLPTRRIKELAKLVLAELATGELSFKEVRALLEPHEAPGVNATFLWRRVQGRRTWSTYRRRGCGAMEARVSTQPPTRSSSSSRPSRRRPSTASSAGISPPTAPRPSRTWASGRAFHV